MPSSWPLERPRHFWALGPSLDGSRPDTARILLRKGMLLVLKHHLVELVAAFLENVQGCVGAQKRSDGRLSIDKLAVWRREKRLTACPHCLYKFDVSIV